MLKPCLRDAIRKTPDELLRAFLFGQFPATVKDAGKYGKDKARARFERDYGSYRRY